jgi:hypothetical protein
MLLFRSEEHVDRWCKTWNAPRGEVLTLDQCWRLAQAWYGDRMSPKWLPRSTAELQALLASVGLAGEFWRLA